MILSPTGRRAWHACLFSAVLSFELPQTQAGTIPYGEGSISDIINPDSAKCVIDHGNWIFNAGVVEPAIDACVDGVPVGTPVAKLPQLVAPASNNPTPSHRWWGSIAFNGEQPVNNPAAAGYITPDPITARLSDKGIRLMGMPSKLATQNAIDFSALIADPFAEVFDGLALGNSAHGAMQAYLKKYSDGTVTAQWRSGSTVVMEATFVYGSPFIYLDVFDGSLQLRSKSPLGPEKGIFHNQGNVLGIWTDVAGWRNNYLIVGHETTQFNDVESAEVTAMGSSRYTVAWLPVSGSAEPSATMISDFATAALTVVDRVSVDYAVDRNTNAVTVTHSYRQADGSPANTLAGLMPLHWKHAAFEPVASYQTRSSRGVIKFVDTATFSYQVPFVGVLPYFPEHLGDYDDGQLQNLVNEFVDQGESAWNTATDTYWAGKNYGKVAELAAIARAHGMTAQADRLINWLKAELEDWFTADSSGGQDVSKYFYYDPEWNTLLGFDESFGAQQQLNDHHFHYGYFVRAAAEICRVDANWCSADQYGPMVDLLIRDYAAGRNDSQFPYLRNFDPTNGFSQASGHANFTRGNNNESTSEAANAYGAIILYGLITNNQALVERGMYLHSVSTASYWQYWNNIDRFEFGQGGELDNFPADYNKITTSIIWGNGAVYSTWFSGLNAHILGIQGLPLNPMVLHIGQYPEYMRDYVALGLSDSGNGKPSGLGEDQWRDVWWNMWALTDAEAAATDMMSMNFNYIPEAGETKAHTYHWVHTLKGLGHLKTGTGELTADSPAAVAFEKNGTRTYLAYNYSGNSGQCIEFSDGARLYALPNSFRVKRSGDAPDTCSGGGGDNEPPTQPGAPGAINVTASSADISWTGSTDNVGVIGYRVTVSNGAFDNTVTATAVSLTGLSADTQYTVQVRALDAAGNASALSSGSFTTNSDGNDDGGSCTNEICVQELDAQSLKIVLKNNTFADLHYKVNNGAQQNIRMAVSGSDSEYAIDNLTAGDRVDYSITKIGIETTPWASHVFQGDGSGNDGDDDGDGTEPGNLLVNGDFSAGSQSWYLAYQDGVPTNASLDTAGGMARVTISLGNGSPERVKLVQDFAFEAGVTYTLSFRVRTAGGSKPVYYSAWIKELDGNFFNNLVWADNSWQTVSHSFSYQGDYSMYTLGMAFKLADGDAVVEIDDVVLTRE